MDLENVRFQNDKSKRGFVFIGYKYSAENDVIHKTAIRNNYRYTNLCPTFSLNVHMFCKIK